jgi:hypothetical protein
MVDLRYGMLNTFSIVFYEDLFLIYIQNALRSLPVGVSLSRYTNIFSPISYLWKETRGILLVLALCKRNSHVIVSITVLAMSSARIRSACAGSSVFSPE